MKKIGKILALSIIASNVLMAQTFTLKQGWNLIGISETGINGNVKIKDVIDTSKISTIYNPKLGSIDTQYIQYYNSAEFVPGYGYWVKANEANVTVSFDGKATTPDYSFIKTSWNLISFNSVSSLKSFVDYMTGIGNKVNTIYNPIVGSIDVNYIQYYSSTNIDPNSGYWVKVQKQIAETTALDGKVKVVVYSNEETTKTPAVSVDSSGNVTITGADGVNGTLSVLVYTTDGWVEIEQQSIVNGSVSNAVTVTSEDLSNVTIKNVLYTVYYAPEGSAPVALTNVDVFDENGEFIGTTNSNGQLSIPATVDYVRFTKDGYASVTVKVDKTSTTGVVFLNTATKTNASVIDSGSTTTAKILNRTLYATTSVPKTLQNIDGTFKATFYNFDVNDSSKYVKLALLDESSVNVDPDYHNIAAFAVELVSVDANGIETSTIADYTDLDSNLNTPPKVDFNITLSNQNVDYVKTALTKNSLYVYQFDGTNWSKTDANATLNDNVLTIKDTSKFTQYIVTFKPEQNVVKSYTILLKDENGNSVEKANVIINGKSYFDANSSLIYKGIVPENGKVNVEVMANGYDYLSKAITLREGNNTVVLKTHANIQHKLKVTDSDGAVLSGAKVKVEVPVVLSSVRIKDGKIYVGKDAKAIYEWQIIPQGKAPISITSATSNYVSFATIYNTLNNNNSLLGDSDIKVKVTHPDGFVEEGDIGYLGVDIVPEDVIDFENITTSNTSVVYGSLQNDGYIFFSDINAVDWKLKLQNDNTKTDIFSGDTLLVSDIGYFIKSKGVDLTGINTIVAVPVDSLGNEVTDVNVTIPLNQITDLKTVLDTIYDVYPATSIPNIIETETDANGEVDLSVINNLKVAISVSKEGYKPFIASKTLDSSNTGEIPINLNKLAMINGYRVYVKDSDGQIINGNIRVVIPNAYTEEVDVNGRTVTVSKDYDETFDNGEITINTDLIKGVKNLKVYAHGYVPYDNLIRVSNKINSTTVTLAQLSEEVKNLTVVKPEMEITYSDMVNDTFVVKGKIADTNDQNTSYSGTSTLTVIFNGDVKTYPIDADGTFTVSLKPQDGVNRVEAIVTNSVGKYDTGEFIFEYFNFNDDITDIDKVVEEANQTIESDFTFDKFAFGSVIDSVKVNNNNYGRGSTIDVNVTDINVTFDLNESAPSHTIYYFTPYGKELKVTDTSSFTINLNPGFNPIYFEARDANNTVLDSFDFIVMSNTNTNNSTTNYTDVNITVSDYFGNTLNDYKIVVFKDYNGMPGEVVDIIEEQSSGTKNIPVPCWVSIEKDDYIPQMIYVDSTTVSNGLSVKLMKEGAVLDTANLTFTADDIKNSVVLDGDSVINRQYLAYFYLDTSLPVDPSNYNYNWSINNQPITECDSFDCSFLPGRYIDENNISATVKVEIVGNVGNYSITIEKTKEVEVESASASLPLMAPEIYAYLPSELEIARGRNYTFPIEIFDYDDGINDANITCDNSNIDLTYNFSSQDWYGDDKPNYYFTNLNIIGQSVGDGHCAINVTDNAGNISKFDFNVRVTDSANIELIRDVHAYTQNGELHLNADANIAIGQYSYFSAWAEVDPTNSPEIKWVLKDGNSTLQTFYGDINYVFDNIGTYTLELNVTDSTIDKTESKSFTINVIDSTNSLPPSPPVDTITDDLTPPSPILFK